MVLMSLIDHQDLVLRTFQKKPHDRICWQPRLFLWYRENQVSQKNPIKERHDGPLKIPISERQKYVPEEYIGKSNVDIFSDLNASIRYSDEGFGINFFRPQFNSDADFKFSSEHLENGTIIREIKTPVGNLREQEKDIFRFEKMVKTREDIKIFEYYIKNLNYYYDKSLYEAALKEMGKFGAIQSRVFFRAPYQACILDFIGFERTIIFLRRYKAEMENLFNTLNEWNREKVKIMLDSDVPIFNFVENIDAELTPPPMFEKYLIPHYEEFVKLLHSKNKICHIHIDGRFHDLLPYFADLPFDGLEALTAEPQGDVTLEEMRDHMGDKILLDGIPAVLFMHHFPEKRLIETTKKVLEYFSPNLILGISDLIPSNGDGRRLKIVSEIVDRFEL